MKKFIASTILAVALPFSGSAIAADYNIDIKGAHAAINFSVSHLGYGWVVGRFNEFDGSFSYDPAKPEESKVNVVINTKSLDSNHAERDKHLRSGDFLDTDKHPEATFKSTGFKAGEGKKAQLMGDLTLRGVTKPVTIDVVMQGAGKDPWGGERIGFKGTTSIPMADYGIDFNLGPASKMIDLDLFIEGVKKK